MAFETMASVGRNCGLRNYGLGLKNYGLRNYGLSLKNYGLSWKELWPEKLWPQLEGTMA